MTPELDRGPRTLAELRIVIACVKDWMTRSALLGSEAGFEPDHFTDAADACREIAYWALQLGRADLFEVVPWALHPGDAARWLAGRLEQLEEPAHKKPTPLSDLTVKEVQARLRCGLRHIYDLF